MPYITEQTIGMVDALAKGQFGRTASEMNAELGILNEERAKSIMLLFTKARMPIEEIAKDLELDVEIVKDALKKQKLIKK